MNLQHLKYMVEVERVGSITKAAANLFMGQPNLSKAIKEVETETGIRIFQRSAKGVVPTDKGARFLSYAHAILVQLEKIEGLKKNDADDRICFGISVPRATYISHAFTCFIKKLGFQTDMEINFKETNSMDSINNVFDGICGMAVIRFELPYEEYFLSLLKEKDLSFETVLEFEKLLLISENSPLAAYDKVPPTALSEMTEILHGDLSVPYVSPSYTKKADEICRPRRIYVYERGSQFDLLKGVPSAFMWVSPMPQAFMKNSGLTLRRCTKPAGTCKDILIYRSSYRMTDTDKLFLRELKTICGELEGSR